MLCFIDVSSNLSRAEEIERKLEEEVSDDQLLEIVKLRCSEEVFVKVLSIIRNINN